MSGKAHDLIGLKFGRLKPLYKLYPNSSGNAVWRCECDCGVMTQAVATDLKKGNTKSCGCLSREIQAERLSKLSGDKHYNWSGGRHLNSKGYVYINISPGKRIQEHRHVMQQHLGRPLTKDETVHHINGVRNDNRLENLELWSKSQPPGQRVEDKVKWAKEILSQYEPVRSDSIW
jgi:hypothetical protein